MKEVCGYGSEDFMLAVGDRAVVVAPGSGDDCVAGTRSSSTLFPSTRSPTGPSVERGLASRLCPDVLRSILSSRASSALPPKRPFVPRLTRYGYPCEVLEAPPDDEDSLDRGTDLADVGGEELSKPLLPREGSKVAEWPRSDGTGGAGTRDLVIDDASDDCVSSLTVTKEVLELLGACESESRKAASSSTRLQSIRFRFGNDGDEAVDSMPVCSLYCSRTASTS